MAVTPRHGSRSQPPPPPSGLGVGQMVRLGALGLASDIRDRSRDPALRKRPSAQALDPRLHRPIFIIGAPRSGTTFLGSCLGRMPEVSYHFEPRLTKAAARWGRIHSAPEGYVRQIMYREQVSWWRRRARRPVTVVARVPERPAQDQMVMVEARLALRDALLALPPGKRAVLVLRYLEDLPEAQVADILGCSVGTVRSQTHKAIAQLRSVLPSLGLTSTEVGR